LKVALIQDWLTIIGGSEYVLKEIASLFPDADIYTLVAQDETIKKLGFEKHKVHTSFIQDLPFAKTKYRNYLPLFPLAIEQFDLTSYDLIISSSHAVAKGVLTHPGQVHVCYCHSPMRYAWDLYHQYIKDYTGIKGFVIKRLLHRMRQWDFISSNRVDYFISNSDYIGKRIKKIYNKESITIYPNVAIQNFEIAEEKDDFYVTASRLVPYKKIDLVVQAFTQMPDKKLYVIGDGPNFKKIKRIATSNIVLLGYQPFDVLKHYLSKARAFVFAAEEDFGILPVEAQACGTPVIAYRKGGVTETVIENKTGVYFNEQTVPSIIEAVAYFESHPDLFKPTEIAKHASQFSTQRFITEMSAFLSKIITEIPSKGGLIDPRS
jgi:glycosyltransferase involved in cell wall biosynthesis